MAGLTVAEKEHWKDRITCRIDRRIEAIEAEEPNLPERIEHQAQDRALESLGLAAFQRELDESAAAEQQRAKREQFLYRAMLAQTCGVPVDQIDTSHNYSLPSEVTAAIQRRQDVFEEELLAESERGSQILRLRQERENLLDTVWLATSPADVRALWGKVSDLLGDEPTPLQREALAIPPIVAA